ncbi:GNAT family N-acetyltransferase [Roseobacter sp. EG26]|uniref:GNAT family N-acetyltransferase n=1 Tax=Roseobacter sp. EG26 TaxID=3412477 RepID=UPI003CE50D3E
MKPFEFFRATDTDAVMLSRLIKRTIRTSNSKDYDQQSIDLLCAIFEPERIVERIRNELIFLCFLGADLVGTVGLKRDYLRSLFVDPNYQKQGFGKMLVENMEGIARKNAISEIMLHSSLTAQNFYAALGYEYLEFQLHDEGPFILMRKGLSESPC